MSCNPENFEKYPYVYECCADKIGGMTVKMVQDRYADGRFEVDCHVACLECGKIYHVFPLGLKWTEVIATKEQLANAYDRLITDEAKGEKPKEFFSMADLSLFVCVICKKGALDNEPYEEQKDFIKAMNGIMSIMPDEVIELVKKEEIIENLMKFHSKSCRACFNAAKEQTKKANYN